MTTTIFDAWTARIPSMDPQIKGWWAEALRSGRYPQGVGALHVLPGGETKEGYCCLGVLCEVAINAGGIELKQEHGSLGDIGADHEFYDGYGQYLPPKVGQWAGLFHPETEEEKGTNPAVTIDEEFCDTYYERFGVASAWEAGEVVELAELNDSPIEFDLIAGLIERNL